MKKKTKVLAGALLAIAMSASVGVGATFALFTSESQVNIAVTSAKVSVNATVGGLTTSSRGKEQKDGMWANGGKASNVGGEVTLERISAGDKVEFDIKVKNESTINVKYRTKIILKEGERLMSGLDMKVGNTNLQNIRLYTSAWQPLADKAELTVPVSIELPERGNEIDNRYNGDYSTKISFVVEAVQANADELDENEKIERLYYVYNTEEAQAALNKATENDTIMLAKGDYDKLYIMPDGAFVKTEGDNINTHAFYHREINNLRIVGEDGVKVNGITLGSSLFNWTTFPQYTDPVTKGSNTFYVEYDLNGLTFENLSLIDGIWLNNKATGVEHTLQNVTIKNCKTLENGDSYFVAPPAEGDHKFYVKLTTLTGVDGLTIEDNEITDRYQGVYLTDVHNVTIANNTFERIRHNAIGFGNECTDITIKNNIMKNGKDRVIRFTSVTEGKLEITDNVMIAFSDSDGEMMKANSVGSDVEVVTKGNYWNGLAKDELSAVIKGIAEDSAPLTELPDGVELPAGYNLPTTAFDFTKAETADFFCADCYNGKGEHANHTPYLDIDSETGVANISNAGAWTAYSHLDWEKKYSYTVDIDLTNLKEGAFVAFDCGETRNWNDMHLGFAKIGDKYYAQKSLSKTLSTEIEVDQQVTAVYTFEKTQNNYLHMTLTLNGVEIYDKTVTVEVKKIVDGKEVKEKVPFFEVNWARATHALCWDVYTYVPAGEETSICAITGFEFSAE